MVNSSWWVEGEGSEVELSFEPSNYRISINSSLTVVFLKERIERFTFGQGKVTAASLTQCKEISFFGMAN